VPDYCFAAVVICAHTLCRWTALPLGYFMSSARDDTGQGARIAGTVSLRTVVVGTALALTVIIYLLRLQFWIPLLASVITTVSTGLYYRHRLNGITGDCFGATNQLTEIAIYLCGIWHHA
jgi:adenosylcobinamide-GDP ribazoletransferase